MMHRPTLSNSGSARLERSKWKGLAGRWCNLRRALLRSDYAGLRIAFILNLQLNSEGSHVFVTTLDTKNYHFYQGFRTHQ